MSPLVEMVPIWEKAALSEMIMIKGKKESSYIHECKEMLKISTDGDGSDNEGEANIAWNGKS